MPTDPRLCCLHAVYAGRSQHVRTLGETFQQLHGLSAQRRVGYISAMCRLKQLSEGTIIVNTALLRNRNVKEKTARQLSARYPKGRTRSIANAPDRAPFGASRNEVDPIVKTMKWLSSR
jgi:hypothetical protein